MGLTKRTRAIIGVGNVLMGDEGVGVHAVRALLPMSIPDDLLVMDGGTEGFGLMDAITQREKLVIVDCIQGGQPPGTIYCFDWQEAALPPDPLKTCMHQVSIADVLHHAALITRVPPTTIVGVEPQRIALGVGLSHIVQAKLPEICELACTRVGFSLPPFSVDPRRSE